MYAFILAVALSLVTVLGDYCVKMSSLRPSLESLKWLIPGALIYAASAFGWFYIFTQKMKFSTAAVVYAVIVIVFHVLLSVFYFHEKIHPVEFIGIGFALISLIILVRFA